MKNYLGKLTVFFLRSAIFKEAPAKEAFDSLLSENGLVRGCDEYLAMLEELYRFCRSQDLAHIVSDGLFAVAAFDTDEAASDEYRERLKKLGEGFSEQSMLAFLRYARQKAELTELSRLFEEEKIRFLPLKGAVLREYYPEGRMRTGCDIDILIDEENLPAAEGLLKERLEYTGGVRGEHDVSYYAPSGTHIELHFTLIEGYVNKKGEELLRGIFDISSPKEGTRYHYEMSDSVFYFYHILHLSKHFLIGGGGIRAFLDIAVMKASEKFDAKGADELFSLTGLEKFKEGAEALCSVWFLGGESSELTELMEEHIFGRSLYGDTDSRVALSTAKRGGRVSHILSRIFYPYERLITIYPALKGHRWRTPFYQVRRWCNLIFKRGRMRASLAELKKTGNISKSESEKIKFMLDSLGI